MSLLTAVEDLASSGEFSEVSEVEDRHPINGLLGFREILNPSNRTNFWFVIDKPWSDGNAANFGPVERKFKLDILNPEARKLHAAIE